MGNDTADKGKTEPDPANPLNEIAEHVVEACILAHAAGEEFLSHLLKMAISELEQRGAFR